MIHSFNMFLIYFPNNFSRIWRTHCRTSQNVCFAQRTVLDHLRSRELLPNSSPTFATEKWWKMFHGTIFFGGISLDLRILRWDMIPHSRAGHVQSPSTVIVRVAFPLRVTLRYSAVACLWFVRWFSYRKPSIFRWGSCPVKPEATVRSLLAIKPLWFLIQWSGLSEHLQEPL